MRGLRLSAVGLLVTALAACTDPGTVLEDSASCPGEECTDDTRGRFDAIGDIDGVTEVGVVSREYGFDRGSARRAEVTADVATKRDARAVGLAVMRELEDWPDHADGPAVVVVRDGTGARPGDLTLRLDDGWVCEQPTRVREPCTAGNSWLVTGERVPN